MNALSSTRCLRWCLLCFLMSDYQTNLVDAKVVCFNHAGSSPSPSSVIKCLYEHQLLEQKVGGYRAAAEMSDRLERVYEKAAKLIEAEKDEIALVESATVGWTRLFYAFCQAQDAAPRRCEQKVILVSEAEYAANVVAACQWSKTRPGWQVLAIPSKLNPDGSCTGMVDVDVLQDMLDGQFLRDDGSVLNPESIALLCLTHVPTNSGIVNPAATIGKMVASFNSQRSGFKLPTVLYLLDSCQSIGQMPVSTKQIQCHGLVATGRKFLRGPRGTGFLYTSAEICSAIIPSHVDHFGLPITKVPSKDILSGPVEDHLGYAPLKGAKRFEMWESNIAGRLALGEAIDALLSYGLPRVQSEILENVERLCTELNSLEHIKVYYPPACGICTFSVNCGLQPGDIKEALWGEDQSDHFEVSIVPATSTPLDSARTQTMDLIRVSVSYTNTADDIQRLCERLRHIC